MSAGMRYDDIQFDVSDHYLDDGEDSGKLDFDQFSYSLGLNRDLGAGVLFALISTSFETPTTTELANPDGPTGFNQNLDNRHISEIADVRNTDFNEFTHDPEGDPRSMMSSSPC